MYPQVEQYYETVDKAYEDYRRKTDDKREATHREFVAEPTKREELNRRFRDARQALQDAYEQAKADAFKELTASIEQTGDQFAAWLVGSDAFTEYPEHSKEVLRILPATQERIREFGREQGWCNVLDDYLRQARNAGAFGPVDQAVVASEQMHSWFTRDFAPYQAYHDRLDGFVNRIVEAKVAKALADAAEARTQAPEPSE